MQAFSLRQSDSGKDAAFGGDTLALSLFPFEQRLASKLGWRSGRTNVDEWHCL